MTMWIPARYRETAATEESVQVCVVGSDLVIKFAGEGREPLYWPLNSLTLRADRPGTIAYQWLPQPARIELADDEALRRAPWGRQLPHRTHRSRMWSGLTWVGVAAVLAAGAVFGLPRAARHIPWSVETALFSHFQPYSASEYCDGQASAEQSLRAIVERLYPLYERDAAISIEVHVVRSPEVNAFATPGGKIFVLEGLLRQADSPEEVGGILAHEIEHVSRRHLMEILLQRALFGILIGIVLPDQSSTGGELLKFFMNAQFTKGQEDEADRGALERLGDAKVDPRGMVKFFEKLEGLSAVPDILSDHPSDEARKQLFQSAPAGHTEPLLDAQQWAALKDICG